MPEWLRRIGDAFRSFLGGLQRGALGVWDAISKLWSAIQGIWDRVAAFVNAHVWGPIKHVFDGLWEGAWLIPTTFGRIMHAIYGMAFRIAHRIEGAFNFARELAGELWGELRSRVWPTISHAFSRIDDIFREVFSNVWGALRYVLSRINDLFRMFVNLMNGFTALVWGAILDKLYDFLDAIGDILDRFIDDHWED
jgi:phage-related protein